MKKGIRILLAVVLPIAVVALMLSNACTQLQARKEGFQALHTTRNKAHKFARRHVKPHVKHLLSFVPHRIRRNLV